MVALLTELDWSVVALVSRCRCAIRISHDALIRASGYTGTIYFRPPFGYKLVGLPWFLWRTGRRTSLAALPGIIDQLQQDGYRFLTISELLSAGRDRTASASVEA